MRKTTITIKRPEGHIETVDVSEKFPRGLTDPMFEQVKQATKKAGKGECISYLVQSYISKSDLDEVREHDKKAAWFEKHGFNGNDIS